MTQPIALFVNNGDELKASNPGGPASTTASVMSGMTIAERSAELMSVISSAQATDGSGRLLDAEGFVARCVDILCDLRGRDGSIYLAGNGGSAAVASHCATDLINAGRVRAMTLHESSLLTCMTNDFGYEHAFARIVSAYARPADALIAISSSGQSANIRNTTARVREIGGTIITLSGFAADNPLRRQGDINIWMNSRDYGMVELSHQFILQSVADRLRLALGPEDVER
jgi:D-sedoheptulose 7-phosphate isomerase